MIMGNVGYSFFFNTLLTHLGIKVGDIFLFILWSVTLRKKITWLCLYFSLPVEIFLVQNFIIDIDSEQQKEIDTHITKFRNPQNTDLLLDPGLVGCLLFPQLIPQPFHQTAQCYIYFISILRHDNRWNSSDHGHVTILTASCAAAAELHGLATVLLRARVCCHSPIFSSVKLPVALHQLPFLYTLYSTSTVLVCWRLTSRVGHGDLTGGCGPRCTGHTWYTPHAGGGGDVVIGGQSLWGPGGITVTGGPFAWRRAPVSPQGRQAIHEPVTSTTTSTSTSSHTRRNTISISRRAAAAAAALLSMWLGTRCWRGFECVLPGRHGLGLFTWAYHRVSFAWWRPQFWSRGWVRGLGGCDGCTQFGIQRWGTAVQLLVGVGHRATLKVLLRYPGSQATMLELMSLDSKLCLGYSSFLLIPPWVQTVVFPDEDCH